MKSRDLPRRLERRAIVALQADDLSDLLDLADTLCEENTSIAESIRILRIDGRIMVQEQLPDTKEVVVRELSSRKEAELFVEKRLKAYERMWDGCGCKIDYFS